MGVKGKLGSELDKLRAEIDDAEAEADEKPVKKRAADVARKAGETVKRQKAAEIDGVSETTMQEFLEETRRVRGLLEDGKISPGKAKTLFDRISEAIGLGEEDKPESDDDESEEDDDE